MHSYDEDFSDFGSFSATPQKNGLAFGALTLLAGRQDSIRPIKIQ